MADILFHKPASYIDFILAIGFLIMITFSKLFGGLCRDVSRNLTDLMPGVASLTFLHKCLDLGVGRFSINIY